MIKIPVSEFQTPGFFICDQPDVNPETRFICAQSDKISQIYDIGVNFEH